MKHFFSTRLLACLTMLLWLLPVAGQAQNIVQSGFTGEVVPQYISSGNNSIAANPGPRLAYVFRATLTGLTANTAYRYFVQGSIATDFGNTGAAGTIISITPGATPAATTYATSSTGSLTTAGSYASFTTDAAGAYTGWFGFVNSINTRFITAGNVVYPMITLATDATPGTIERRALNLGATVQAFGTATTNGTLLTGASSATPKNLVFTYDNTAGTGRPVSGGLIEAVGVATGAATSSYAVTNGSYNVVIPNSLANGVRRVEERSVVTGTVLNCNSDADGNWPSGANTVNPTSGATPVVLTATDAPLNAGCGAAATATVTATPAALTAFTTEVGTASATQTVTVGGTTLTADVVVTAPAGYEVSLSAATGFAASLTVAQTGGTAASTPLYVRLTGTTAGAFAGNVTVASTGATTANVAVAGTVTAVATPAPTITSFTPTSALAGATVTITGTDFSGATAVTLNGAAITGFTVVNATTITFVVPAAATSGTIAVTTHGGTATSTGTFTVTAPVPVPTVASFSPARALAGGPAFELTITGTNLTAATTVSFNGGTYTAASATATSLKVNIPASAIATAGSYPITVTNAGGTSNSLTYLVVAPAATVAYEDFEQGVKTSFATGDVTLRSGVWTFNEALIGDLLNDRVNQVKGARVRGAGSIAMKFDKPNGAGVVSVLAAAYGTDTPGFFTAEVSTDGGATYTALTGAATNPTVLTTTLVPFSFTVNRAGNVRLRFTATGTGTTPRINFDDLTIADFTASATLASKALPGLTVSPNPATDRITVSLPKAGAATVALRDLTGRLVLAPAALAATRELRLPAGLAAGVYLLEVRQGAVTAVRRIQKD